MADNRNLFQRIFSPSAATATEAPVAHVRSYNDFGGGTTYTPRTEGKMSLGLPAVFACTSRIAQTVASLELNTFKATGNGRDVVNHNLTNLLTNQPHPRYNAFDWWELLVSDSLLWGAGYAAIVRDGSTVIALEYIPASNVAKNTYEGRDIYTVSYTDRKYGKQVAKYESKDLFIVNGYRAMSPIALHAESLSLAMNSRQFGNDFFKNGGVVSGVLKMPAGEKGLSQEQYTALKTGWHANYHGMNNSHSTAILEYGMDYQRISIPPEEAQFIETRNYSDQEIARIFGVPAALIGLDANVTYSNVEQQNMHFATYTLRPLIKRIENEIKVKLISQNQRKSTDVVFDMSSLLRADSVNRSAYYREMQNMGAMTINEVRAKEGFNPIQGGDTALVQVNQLPLDQMAAYGDKLTEGTTDGSTADNNL